MERVTGRIPRQQVEQGEQSAGAGQYPNRSEAVRSTGRTLGSGEQRGRRDHNGTQE